MYKIKEDLAYHGLLGDYFQRGGLKFNYATGLFEIEHDIKGTVKLVGSGKLYNMASKALKRTGYIPDLTGDGPYIEILSTPEGKEIIICDGKTLPTIESLVAKLRKDEYATT